MARACTPRDARPHADSLAADHHLLLAHGLSTAAIRASTSDANISLAINAGVVRAFSDDPADVDAARRIDGLLNRIFLDPVFKGAYPQDVLADTAEITDWSFVRGGDREIIGAPINELGLNYYQPDLVSAANPPRDEPHGPYRTATGHLASHRRPAHRHGLAHRPERALRILLRIKRDYGDVPLYVTENGAAFPDKVVDGQVNDTERIDFLHQHLIGPSHGALEAGANLRGYFVWSLLDNFEWALGYSKRFGIVHVDYETQVRTVKDSGLEYARILASHHEP